jgi:hypothetical protein
MLRYEFSPGNDPHAPEHWPTASGIPRVAEHSTLLVFAHPKCPCTGATLDELAEIVMRAGAETKPAVLFFTPSDAGTAWTQTASVRRAAAILGVNVIADQSGREAQLFHASTSGRTLLYSPDGGLLFDGGITGSRGHVGENPGATAVVMLLAQRLSVHATTPVFGCSILRRFDTHTSPPCQR